jgi:WD40 repeat protein
MEPRRLCQLVQGDLDWIVMKALSKERSRRYETANAFAHDLERYLADEPVQAGPPRAGYRLRKFVRRHKGKVLAAGAMLGLLAAGVVASTWQAIRATWAEQATDVALRAETSAKEEALQAQMQAKENERRAREREREARHYWYGADVNLAQQSLELGNGLRLRQTLSRQVPKPDQEDIRGFEWHYLWRQRHSEKMTLTGHTQRVDRVVFSPDGKRLTSASGAEVRVWDLVTGRMARTISVAPARCTAIAFTADGANLALGVAPVDLLPFTENVAPFTQVQIWDIETGRRIREFKKGVAIIEALAFSKDGNSLTIVERDDSVAFIGKPSFAEWLRRAGVMGLSLWIWDLTQGQGKSVPLAATDRQIMQPASVRAAIVADGKTLAAVGPAMPVGWPAGGFAGSVETQADRSERVFCWWDATTGQLIKVLRDPKFWVSNTAFSPSGSGLAYMGIGGTIGVLDTQSGQEQAMPGPPVGPSAVLSFSSDGKMLAATSDAITVMLWDIGSGKRPMILYGHEQPIQCIAFSPDGKLFAAGGEEHTLKVWDTTDAMRPKVLPLQSEKVDIVAAFGAALGESPVKEMVFTPHGEGLATPQNNQIPVWDVATGQIRYKLKWFADPPAGSLLEAWLAPAMPGFGNMIRSIAVSPDRKLIAAAGGGGVKVWDLATAKEQVQIPSEECKVVHFTPNGLSLLVESGYWDTATWKKAEKPPPDFLADAKVFAPDGQTFLTARSHGGEKHTLVALRDITSGTARFTVDVPEVSVATFTPDGKRIALDLPSGAVKWLDAANGQELAVFKGKWRGLSPDGQTAVTTDLGGAVMLWTIESGQEQTVLQGHTQAIFSVAFSPDGRTVATASADRTVKLWDPLTGQERLTLRHEGRTPLRLSFAPDGMTLAVSWGPDPSGRINSKVVTLFQAKSNDTRLRNEP